MRAGIRTIIVPADIVAVQRRSPVPVKKRTPWRPRPDGEVLTERAGAREWFSDRLFVEAQRGNARAAFGLAIAVHVFAALLIVVLVARFNRTLLVHAGASRVRPVVMSLKWFTLPPSPGIQSLKPSAPQSGRVSSVAPPPVAAAPKPPAPVDAPSTIEPETGAEGATDGVEGGVAGGVLDGMLSAGPSSPGPLRLGGGGSVLKPPRKIKDVKPVYPQGALSEQARGIVVIEATIGIDGKVNHADVVHSVPALDQAALDAVRQWEFAPSLLNGMPVAVIMTVIVNFAIQ